MTEKKMRYHFKTSIKKWFEGEILPLLIPNSFVESIDCSKSVSKTGGRSKMAPNKLRNEYTAAKLGS